MSIKNTKKRQSAITLAVLIVLIGLTGATLLTSYGTITGIANVEASLEIENSGQLSNNDGEQDITILNKLEEDIENAQLTDEGDEELQEVMVTESSDDWRETYTIDLEDEGVEILRLKIDDNTVQEVDLT